MPPPQAEAAFRNLRRPRSRPEIRTLADLGNFLSGTGIDPGAFKREMAGCAALLVARRDALAGDEDFKPAFRPIWSVLDPLDDCYSWADRGRLLPRMLP